MKEVADKRYRILVTLKRDDRHKYWDFRCPYCGTKVCEISGSRLILLDDGADVYKKRSQGFLCPGAYRQICENWYYFEEMLK